MHLIALPTLLMALDNTLEYNGYYNTSLRYRTREEQLEYYGQGPRIMVN